MLENNQGAHGNTNFPSTQQDRQFDYFFDYERIVSHMLNDGRTSLDELRTDIATSVMLGGLQFFGYDSLPTYLVTDITRLVGPLRFERALETAQAAISATPRAPIDQPKQALWFLFFLLGFPPLHDADATSPHPGAVDERVRRALHAGLQSANLQIRWMSALSLGRLRDVSALPTLYAMLTEELSLDHPYSECGPSECARWREWIPSLLALWNPPDSRAALVAALVTALTHVIAAEDAIPMPTISEVIALGKPTPTSSPFYDRYLQQEEWTMYEQQLVYALGYLQAYEEAERIPFSSGVSGIYTRDMYDPYSETWLGDLDPQREPVRRNIWRVHMAMGSLETTAVAANRPPKIGMAYSAFWQAPALEEAVARRLAEWYGGRGMDAAQRQRAMLEYGRASWLFHITSPSSYNLLLWQNAFQTGNATSPWLDIGQFLARER